jgi:hypothetical protein
MQVSLLYPAIEYVIKYVINKEILKGIRGPQCLPLQHCAEERLLYDPGRD